MNWNEIRQDFPILKSTMRGKRFVYLDSAATSLKPNQVLEVSNRYYQEYGVNIHRGVYEFSERASQEYEEVRSKLAEFIGLPKPAPGSKPSGHIIFTKSSTESSNLVAYSWGRVFLKEGDEILSTELEHHSTLVPWHPVCEKTGALMRFVPMTDEGSYTLDDFRAALSKKTKLVVVSAMSNVTGFIPPIKEMIRLAHELGAKVVLDAAQYVSHHPLNVVDLDCDFLYFSAHKMLGPTGLGFLYGKTELLDEMEPFLYGGDMILRVWKDHSSYHPLPEKFEAGTPNIAGVIGFGRALDYLNSIGMEKIRAWEQELLSYTIDRMKSLEQVRVYGPSDPKIQGAILSFNLNGIHCHDLGAVLDARGIAVRTGFHCAQPLMDRFGISGTVRASMYFYNDFADIDELVEAVLAAQSVFVG